MRQNNKKATTKKLIENASYKCISGKLVFRPSSTGFLYALIDTRFQSLAVFIFFFFFFILIFYLVFWFLASHPQISICFHSFPTYIVNHNLTMLLMPRHRHMHKHKHMILFCSNIPNVYKLSKTAILGQTVGVQRFCIDDNLYRHTIIVPMIKISIFSSRAHVINSLVFK